MDPSIRNLMEERAAIDRQELYWHSTAQDIAEEFSCPVSEIEKMLRAETHQLEQEAHIKDFVPLLAIKQVKAYLKSESVSLFNGPLI